MIAPLLDHLWQSTLFALAAGLATLALRRNSAGVRYGLWLAASVKFLVPFALLAAAGGALVSRLHLTLVPPEAATAAALPSGGALQWAPQMMAPAAAFAALPAAAPASHALAVRFDPAPVLVAAWTLGLMAILLIWAVRWSRIRAAMRDAAPIDMRAPIPALSTPARLEPGVVGLWRPVLVLPDGIADRLSPDELSAIVAHELCHVRRRDNLTGAIHMLVQALFWFHPLVWWVGARLVVERERACDEAVVRAGHDRETYARGVIETCRLYLHSPLPCVAGASGSSLEMRVDEILCRPLSSPLALEAKASMAMAGALVLTAPVAVGLLTAPPVARPLAQLVEAAQTAALPAFPVRPSSPPAQPSTLDGPAASGGAAAPVARAEPAKPIVVALAPPQITVAAEPRAAADMVRRIAEPPVFQITPPTPEPAETAAAPAAAETATPAEMRRQAYTFAQMFGATSAPLDQLARWTQPVCLTVQGLQADAAAKIAARVAEAAGELGVGTGAAGCKPNLQVLFTDKPQALLDKVAAEHERMLGYWHRRDRDKLKTVTHPVQAWYVTGTGGEGGNVTGLAFASISRASPRTDGPQRHGLQIDDEDNGGWAATGCGDNSRFTACLTSEFQSVLVVVDTGKAQGAGLGPLADYVTMLAMAQPRSLDSCGALPSVIELFARGCTARAGAAGMTRADSAYLAALYKIDLQARKVSQQRAIGDRMADLLLKGEARDRLAAQAPAAGTARR